MSDEEKTFEHKVSEWLSSESYRLEYLTQTAFIKAGIDAVMSAYVESPNTKPRENHTIVFEIETYKESASSVTTPKNSTTTVTCRQRPRERMWGALLVGGEEDFYG